MQHSYQIARNCMLTCASSAALAIHSLCLARAFVATSDIPMPTARMMTVSNLIGRDCILGCASSAAFAIHSLCLARAFVVTTDILMPTACVRPVFMIWSEATEWTPVPATLLKLLHCRWKAFVFIIAGECQLVARIARHGHFLAKE